MQWYVGQYWIRMDAGIDQVKEGNNKDVCQAPKMRSQDGEAFGLSVEHSRPLRDSRCSHSLPKPREGFTKRGPQR